MLHILPLAHGSAWRRAARAFAWPSIDRLFGYFARRVKREDNVPCEHLQRQAALYDSPPRLALHEERIGSLDEAYALAVTGIRTGAFRWPEG